MANKIKDGWHWLSQRERAPLPMLASKNLLRPPIAVPVFPRSHTLCQPGVHWTVQDGTFTAKTTVSLT